MGSKHVSTLHICIWLFFMMGVFACGGVAAEDPSFGDIIRQLLYAVWTAIKSIVFLLLVLGLIFLSLLCFGAMILGFVVDLVVSLVLSLATLSANLITPVSSAFQLAGIYCFRAIPSLADYFF